MQCHALARQELMSHDVCFAGSIQTSSIGALEEQSTGQPEKGQCISHGRHGQAAGAAGRALTPGQGSLCWGGQRAGETQPCTASRLRRLDMNAGYP